MEIKRNILEIFCRIGILIPSIGLTAQAQNPPQVPWTGPLLTCNTSVSDALLGNCLVDIFVSLRNSWGAGIPALGVIPMDPCWIGQVILNATSTAISFDASFTNVTITGINSLSNLQFILNTTGGTLSYTVTYPTITANGFYTASGTLLPTLLPPIVHVDGSGSASFEFDTITFVGTMGLTQGIVGGETVLVVNNVVSDFTIDDYSFNLQNFGGVVLGSIINGLANGAKGSILTSIKPAIIAQIEELILLFFNPFLQTQPYLANMLNL